MNLAHSELSTGHRSAHASQIKKKKPQTWLELFYYLDRSCFAL